MGKKVLFFGDFGIDDIIALLYSYYSDKIDIIGIVADYGNVPKENAVRTARYLQKIFHVKGIPVIGGAAKPMTGREPVFFPDIHGLQGLGPIQIPEEHVSNFENFYEIAPLIKRYGEQLAVVSVGRLTSLAAAFLFFPGLMERIKQIFIMGGAFHFPGNVTPVAEANIYGDPFAANIVFTHATVKTNIFPLNVTNKAFIPPQTMEYVKKALEKSNGHAAKVIKPLYEYYNHAYKKMDPAVPGAPLHDLMVMWAFEEPGKVKFIDVPIKVVSDDGESFGQTIGDFRNRKEKADYPIHNVALDFDYASFVRSFVETFMSPISR